MADWRGWCRKVCQKTKSILRRRSGRKIKTSTSAHSTGENTSGSTVVRHVVNTGHDSGSTYEERDSAATAEGEEAQPARAISATHSEPSGALADSDASAITIPTGRHTDDHPPAKNRRPPTFKERMRSYPAQRPKTPKTSQTDTGKSRAADAEITALRPEDVGTRRYRMVFANAPYGAEDGGPSDGELSKPCPQSERSLEL